MTAISEMENQNEKNIISYTLNPYFEIKYLIFALLIICIGILWNGRWEDNIKALVIVSFIFIIIQCVINRLKMIKLDNKNGILTLYYINYFGIKKVKEIILKDLYYTHKKESISRMSAYMVLRLKKGKKTILKLVVTDNGLTETDLSSLVENVKPHLLGVAAE